jgi:Fungal specific transcription factor domain
VDVPQMAFDCEYLMNAMLSVSAMHLHFVQQDNPKFLKAAHEHLGLAISKYHDQLAQLNNRNSTTVFAASTLISFQATTARRIAKEGPYELPLQWFHMAQVGRWDRTSPYQETNVVRA